MNNAFLSTKKQEILRNILLKELDKKEYIYIETDIIDSWEHYDEYALVFKNMRPNCISYLIEKESYEQEIRLLKLERILEK